MPEPTADDARASQPERWDAWQLYFETTALLTARVEERLKARDCSLMEYQLLVLLYRAPGQCLRMGELARRLVFSPSRLNYQVKVLGERGWVERRPARGDGRGWEAVLAPGGVRAYRALRPQHARDVEELFFASLTDEDVARLGDLMARVARGLGDAGAAPAPPQGVDLSTGGAPAPTENRDPHGPEQRGDTP